MTVMLFLLIAVNCCFGLLVIWGAIGGGGTAGLLELSSAPTGKNASTTLKFSAEVMRRNFGARVYAPKLFYQAMLHAPKIFKAY